LGDRAPIAKGGSPVLSLQSKMIKAILFDLDDTLIDFKGMKKAAITEAANSMVKAGFYMKAYEKLNKRFFAAMIA
jgi:FMN phosphatase YigB (HAD superfamily)